MEGLEAIWSNNGYEVDELVRELLYDASSESSPMNQLDPGSYSVPTMEDFHNAFSTANHNHHIDDVTQPRVSILEKGLSKIDHKYTLKIKCSGSGMGDDGYKWRKYGQKFIKNSPNPRSYYRCTNPRCSAKKQVERSREEQDTLIITYEGLHLHYTYPYFMLTQPEQDQVNHPPPPPSKKPKSTFPKTAETEVQEVVPIYEDKKSPEVFPLGPLNSPNVGYMNELGSEEMGSQGLLEDMVPFLIRNPSNNQPSNHSSPSSSYPSPPTSPSSSPSWSPLFLF